MDVVSLILKGFPTYLKEWIPSFGSRKRNKEKGGGGGGGGGGVVMSLKLIYFEFFFGLFLIYSDLF